jgi:hypothetical protein
MARKNILRKVGEAFVGLAAGGMCLNPLQAQPPAVRVQPGGQAAESAGAPLAVDKEVTVAANGSFRATILTRSGNLVPGARLTFTPQNAEGVVRATTGSAGITVVTGVKPGLHHLHVEAPQGSYDGTLHVKSSAVVQTVALVTPLVAFVLTPGQNQDQNQDQEDAGLLTPEDRARHRLLCAGALAGGATAIALPLALQGGGRPNRRASP